MGMATSVSDNETKPSTEAEILTQTIMKTLLLIATLNTATLNISADCLTIGVSANKSPSQTTAKTICYAWALPPTPFDKKANLIVKGESDVPVTFVVWSYWVDSKGVRTTWHQQTYVGSFSANLAEVIVPCDGGGGKNVVVSIAAFKGNTLVATNNAHALR